MKVGSKFVGRFGRAEDPTTLKLSHFEDDCFEEITADYV